MEKDYAHKVGRLLALQLSQIVSPPRRESAQREGSSEEDYYTILATSYWKELDRMRSLAGSEMLSEDSPLTEVNPADFTLAAIRSAFEVGVSTHTTRVGVNTEVANRQLDAMWNSFLRINSASENPFK